MSSDIETQILYAAIFWLLVAIVDYILFGRPKKPTFKQIVRGAVNGVIAALNDPDIK